MPGVSQLRTERANARKDRATTDLYAHSSSNSSESAANAFGGDMYEYTVKIKGREWRARREAQREAIEQHIIEGQ
jgi:hypothetical protein